MPILIFDLDGTVLSVNSFRNWVRYLLYGRFAAYGMVARAGLSLKTLLVMVERKLLRQEHAVTKGRLQRLWSQAVADDPAALAGLVTELVATVRLNLQEILTRIAAQEQDAVLATAAAEDYALALGQRLGFRHILATPPLGDGRGGQQNLGIVKRDRTLAFLQQQGWEARPKIFFTDHAEDMPLIAVSDIVFWLGDEVSLVPVQSALPNKTIISARSLSHAALMDALNAPLAIPAKVAAFSP